MKDRLDLSVSLASKHGVGEFLPGKLRGLLPEHRHGERNRIVLLVAFWQWLLLLIPGLEVEARMVADLRRGVIAHVLVELVQSSALVLGYDGLPPLLAVLLPDALALPDESVINPHELFQLVHLAMHLEVADPVLLQALADIHDL